MIVVFASIMAVAMLGYLKVGQALSLGSRNSAVVYSNIQNYRATSELICYKYLTEIESVVVTKDLNADWLSVSNRAIYTQAIKAILDNFNDAEYNGDGWSWFVHTPSEAIASMNVSDATIVEELCGELSSGLEEFTLYVPEVPIIDPLSDDSFETVRTVYLELQPFEINIDMDVKGEDFSDVFIVSGMFLLINIQNVYEESDDTVHAIANLSFVEPEGGCVIYREHM